MDTSASSKPLTDKDHLTVTAQLIKATFNLATLQKPFVPICINGLVTQYLPRLVNHRHHQPASTVNLDPMWLNAFTHKIRMVCAGICVGRYLFFSPVCRLRLGRQPFSLSLGPELSHPLVMLKPLGERHTSASVCHPLGLKAWLLPAATDPHRDLAGSVQDVPTVQCTLL